MQTRAISGVDFENTLISNQWKKNEIKPKMIWDVDGKNIFDKIEHWRFKYVYKEIKSLFNLWKHPGNLPIFPRIFKGKSSHFP